MNAESVESAAGVDAGAGVVAVVVAAAAAVPSAEVVASTAVPHANVVPASVPGPVAAYVKDVAVVVNKGSRRGHKPVGASRGHAPVGWSADGLVPAAFGKKSIAVPETRVVAVVEGVPVPVVGP